MSFDGFVHNLDVALRISAAALRVLFDTSSGKYLLDQTTIIYGAQLHPGEHSDDLTLRCDTLAGLKSGRHSLGFLTLTRLSIKRGIPKNPVPL